MPSSGASAASESTHSPPPSSKRTARQRPSPIPHSVPTLSNGSPACTGSVFLERWQGPPFSLPRPPPLSLPVKRLPSTGAGRPAEESVCPSLHLERRMLSQLDEQELLRPLTTDQTKRVAHVAFPRVLAHVTLAAMEVHDSQPDLDRLLGDELLGGR